MEDSAEILIPIVMFISFAATFMVGFYLKFKTKAEAQQTIRMALEKGADLDPEFIKQIAEPEPPKDRDLRTGMIWLALGLGMACLSLGIDDADATGPILGSASFPALIGLAYLVMWWYGSRK